MKPALLAQQKEVFCIDWMRGMGCQPDPQAESPGIVNAC